MKCEEISRYLSPYLDSELDPKSNFEMSAHFENCVPCRERCEGERRIEHAIAFELKKSDPLDGERWNRLKSRVQRPRGGGGLWAVGLLALIAAATALLVHRHHAAAGLAQDLRNEFLTFEAGRAKLDLASPDPKAVESFCRDRLGLPLRVPVKLAGLELEGVRKCLLRGATAAFLSYRTGDRHVSVFVFSADHLDRFPPGDRVVQSGLDESEDIRVAVLRSNWKVVCGVGMVSPDELGAACAAFQE